MTKIQSRLCLLLLSPLLAAAPLAHVNAEESEGKSFVDSFATLDTSRWYVSDGWSNGAHQNCIWSASRVHVGPQGLRLELADIPAKDHSYTCAEIQTHQVFGYGTYETRVRSVAAPGTVTALFTYIGPPTAKIHDEIDFEFLGKDPKAVQLNYFANGQGGNEYMARFDFNAAEGFNDYAFEWLPDRLRWFINGKLVHELHATPGKPFPSHPSKIYLSLWNGVGEAMEPWLAKFVYPGQPLIATYEYVAFTKLGDPCQFPSSIVCETKIGSPKP